MKGSYDLWEGLTCSNLHNWQDGFLMIFRAAKKKKTDLLYHLTCDEFLMRFAQNVLPMPCIFVFFFKKKGFFGSGRLLRFLRQFSNKKKSFKDLILFFFVFRLANIFSVCSCKNELLPCRNHNFQAISLPLVFFPL